MGLSIGAHSRDDHQDAKPGEGEESSEKRYIISTQRKNRGGGMSGEAAYKLRTVFMPSVVLNSQTTPSHAAALWFPQGFGVEFQPGRLVAISELFHCWNRFWSANTEGPTKHPQNTIVFSHYK